MITFIAFGLVGCLLLYISYCLGVKKQITLMHDYHYTHMKEIDKPAYCKGMSVGFLLLTITFFMSGYLYSVEEMVGATTILLVGNILSVLYLIKTQIKYNGSIM